MACHHPQLIREEGRMKSDMACHHLQLIGEGGGVKLVVWVASSSPVDWRGWSQVGSMTIDT